MRGQKEELIGTPGCWHVAVVSHAQLEPEPEGVSCRRNVKWMAKDATELELPAASFDVVFSNWLLMYLSDAEVTKLAADALCWVRAQPHSPSACSKEHSYPA